MTQLLRYGAVGLANTALTLAIIAACLALGWHDYPANALGYAAGLTLSFFANRRFTFEVRGGVDWREARGFIAAFAIAYTLNLAVIAGGRSLGLTGNAWMHLAGMGVYSLAFFVAMKQLAFTPAERAAVPLARASALPVWALAGTVAASMLVLIAKPLTHDVVWQFWIARQMLGGAMLYRDIWEVNPPLWFWSAMPIEALAGATGVSPFRYLNALIVAAGAFSAWATMRLAGPLSKGWSTWLVCGAFALAIWTEPFDFGQREQLALIGALPYAALIARRRDGQAVPLPLACAIGMLAAYGFALKHYFALAPLLLEAWLFLGVRRSGAGYRPVRPETVMLGAGALAYLGAVLIFAPDFLRTMVPMVSLAYGGYEEPIAKWFDEPAQTVWGVAIVALLYSHRNGPPARALEKALLLVASAFAMAYFLQAKGWQYHAMPVSAALLLALAVRMIDAAGVQRVLLAVPIALALLLGQIHGSYRNYLRTDDETLLERAAPGAAVAVFSADPMWAWPTAEENGHVWSLNLYSHWMMPTLAQREVAGTMTPELRGLARTVRLQAVRDMTCTPPAVILFERQPRYPIQPRVFDVTGFFLSEPSFDRLLAQSYRETERTPLFRVFERTAPVVPAARPADCRPIAAPRWQVERHDVAGAVVAVRAPELR